ncbi:hypothetical protein [Pseudonocardia pini]|uniref:hypothetical protein n=1 Tax=Pseudonocardia pini TaxID=2758030 RepID=UPI001C68CC36|nr:hypothetical protein [Pseudonocardia pini]
MRNVLPTVIVLVLAAALGGAAVVYGGADDSPGLQLIGVVLVVGAIAWGVRRARRARGGPRAGSDRRP